MPLSFHYADPGATTTLCGKPLDGENYTNQADVEIDCGACYIAALRGNDPSTALAALSERQTKEIIERESAGLRYCYSCQAWEDDTDCLPGDHSRHCGHALKPLSLDLSPAYRLICAGRPGEEIALSLLVNRGDE